MYIGLAWGHGPFTLLGDIIEDIFGEGSFDVVFWAVLFICLILYVIWGYYRETKLYKRIMGDKAKPCLYDGRGKRIRNPDGTPIEKPEEDAEPGTLEESEAADGEQEEEMK